MNWSLFTKPYRSLPAAIFTLFILFFVLNPDSTFYTHHLSDPDDYMRLNEVVSWMKGQSWYDLSVPRLSPGSHTIVHWSRLVDIPIALTAHFFLFFFDINNAVFAAGLLVPLMWFGVFLTLLPALGKTIMTQDRAHLICLMVLSAPLLLFNFSPGRVDHHGIQALIAGFNLLSLCKIIQDDQAIFFAIVSALISACGFWIGTEALPWVMLFIFCLTIVVAWQGSIIARYAAIYGVSLSFFTTLLLPLALPASDFSSRALSWFSPAYAIFAMLSAGIFILGWLITRGIEKRFLRIGVYFFLSLAAMIVFFAFIPSATRGPFTDYDTFDATVALDNIGEAIPLIQTLHFNRFMPVTLIPATVTILRLILLPLIAFFVCLEKARRTTDTLRIVWLTHGLFLGTAFLLTVFWQMRVGIFMEVFSLAPLTYLLCAWWDRLSAGLWGRPLFWAEIFVFLSLGPLPVFIIPSIISHISLPRSDASSEACPAQTFDTVLAFLNNDDDLGAHPLTIMNVSDLGPRLLLDTQHNVVSGNFDVSGNVDAYRFFHSTDDNEAQAAAHVWNADLVLVCPQAPTIYLDKSYYSSSHVRLQKGDDGMLRLTNIDRSQPLIERLIRGESPSWLKQIEIPGNTGYLLFKIQDSISSGKK